MSIDIYKQTSMKEPKTIAIPDDFVVLFPKPSERIKSIIQKVPLTCKVLFLYKLHRGISEEWKTWAWEMMEKGMETPGIIQLAGEDLYMNPFEFASLVSKIIQELGIELTNDDVYYQYALVIGRQVLLGELTAEEGFKILTQAAIDTDYHDAFMHFYYLEDHANLLRDNLPGCLPNVSMQKDTIKEWMHIYFEKLIKRNED